MITSVTTPRRNRTSRIHWVELDRITNRAAGVMKITIGIDLEECCLGPSACLRFERFCHYYSNRILFKFFPRVSHATSFGKWFVDLGINHCLNYEHCLETSPRCRLDLHTFLVNL